MFFTVDKTADWLLEMECLEGDLAERLSGKPKAYCLHCTVDAKWSRKLKNEIDRAIRLCVVEYGDAHVAIPKGTTSNLPKFVGLMGFTHSHMAESYDGVECDIYIRKRK